LKYLLTALGLSLLSFTATHAAARDISVGVENIDYQPFYSYDGKNYTGVMKDLFDAFAKKHKHTAKYEPLPPSRLFDDHIKGKFNAKMPDHPNWSAEEKKKSKLVYSDPIVLAKEAVLVLKEKIGTLTPEQVAVVGTVKGFTPFALLDLIKSKKVKIEENANLEGLVSQTLKGRNNGAYMEETVAKNVLKKLGKTGNELVIYDKLPVDEHPFLISFQEKDKELLKEFNAFLKTEEAKTILGSLRAR
jgi:polar amino acid transport system substrate-binding protein